MNKLLILLFLFTLSVNSQVNTKVVTEKPNVRYTNVSNVIINTIQLEQNKTFILLEVWKTKPDKYQSWISFSSNTYLVDNVNFNRYKIQDITTHDRNIELDEKISIANGNIYGPVGTKDSRVYFIGLFFPPLPSGVENISIKEEINGDGFVWSGITINNPDKSITTNWNESKLKNHWKNNGVDNIEGIYENTASSNDQPKYKLAIVKNSNSYETIYLSGANDLRWNEGDVKAILKSTATTGLFSTNWYMGDKVLNNNVYTSFENGFMKVVWTDGNPESLYLKLYPTGLDSNNVNSSIKSSGTGFALTSNGLIVTNNHVIDGANSIKIKGVNGNFKKIYNATILIKDEKNDLAILKIDDKNFESFGTLPYMTNFNIVDVGSSVYSLGYPLRATMGDEVKLTNGIISSKTGFKGDITSYQTSVPVQSGNSGGPLFSNKGDIVGIVNSKHLGAENVSYAIKTSYLKNLMQSLDTKLDLTKHNSISNLNLTSQIKKIKKYVYIIEVN